MNRACLVALATAAFLAACTSEKPAVSDTATTNPELASPAGTALPADTAASQVVTPVEQTPAPSTKPSSPATKPARTATTVPKRTVTAAPTRVTPVPVTPAPVAAAPKPTAPPPPPAPVVAAAPSASDQAAAGKAPYEESCRRCHGTNGVPSSAMKAMFPKIAAFDGAFVAKRSSESIVSLLTKGNGEAMKPYEGKLSHAQMVAVAAYIRSFAK
jgi:mono/diheme cytochrome c family protein